MTTSAKKKIFHTQLDVRFGDVDPAGIAYYPKIFDFIHQAFESLWALHVGKRYYHLVSEDRLGSRSSTRRSTSSIRYASAIGRWSR